MKKIIRFLLTAGFALAIIFTTSCSEKCKGKKYDPETQFCYDSSKVIEKCGGKEYEPLTHYCHSDSKTYSCDNMPFNPDSQFCDSRDKKLYKFVTIGEQTWMAENLNYEAEGSKCYDNDPANCNKYGRLYNWETAMKVCPNGWHLSSKSDWGKLSEDLEDCSLSGSSKRLSCDDTYGFSVLPSGSGRPDGKFGNDINLRSIWWSDSENPYKGALWWIVSEPAIGVYSFVIDNDDTYSGWYNYNKTYFLSVRCVKD